MKKLIQYTAIKRKIKKEINQSVELKNWAKAKNLCKRLDRVKNSIM